MSAACQLSRTRLHPFLLLFARVLASEEGGQLKRRAQSVSQLGQPIIQLGLGVLIASGTKHLSDAAPCLTATVPPGCCGSPHGCIVVNAKGGACRVCDWPGVGGKHATDCTVALGLCLPGVWLAWRGETGYIPVAHPRHSRWEVWLSVERRSFSWLSTTPRGGAHVYAPLFAPQALRQVMRVDPRRRTCCWG